MSTRGRNRLHVRREPCRTARVAAARVTKIVAAAAAAVAVAVVGSGCGGGSGGGGGAQHACAAGVTYQRCDLQVAANVVSCGAPATASCPDPTGDATYGALSAYLGQSGFTTTGTSALELREDGDLLLTELDVALAGASAGGGETAQLLYDVTPGGSHASAAAVFQGGVLAYGLGVASDGRVGKLYVDARGIPGVATARPGAEEIGLTAGAISGPLHLCTRLCPMVARAATCGTVVKGICADLGLGAIPCFALTKGICSAADPTKFCDDLCGPTCTDQQVSCEGVSCCDLCQDCTADGTCLANDAKLCGGVCCPTSAPECVNGACRECPRGEIPCASGPGLCFTEDENNCGACGQACAAGERCCGGQCVDTTSDPDNCGDCGSGKPGTSGPTNCTSGQLCIAGQCAACGSTTCAGTCCAGNSGSEPSCVDLDKDNENCGACGNACAAGKSCRGGLCACSDSVGFTTDCGGAGGAGGAGGTSGMGGADGASSGSSNGDPHDVTFDGLFYDFQAAGEFLLVSDGAGYVVHVRQQPYRGSTTIAVNTAVAAQVGTDRVGFYVGDDSVLHVDGTPLVAPGSLTLYGGGTIASLGDGRYVVTWPSGDRLAVSVGTDHLDVFPTLLKGSPRTIAGLLGDADGDTSNDLALRGGGVLARPVRFGDLHPRYADSWRITQAESLFDYQPGESTATFTDPSFPSARASAAVLPATYYNDARAACAGLGVSVPALLDACVLDVAAAQDTRLAASYTDVPTPSDYVSLAYYATDFEMPPGAEWSSSAVARSGGTSGYAATSFLGPFANQTVTLTLANAPARDTVSVAFDLYVIGPWDGSAAFSSATAGATLIDTTFSNGASSQAYPSVVTDGATHPARTGATATDVLGLVAAGAPLPDAVYHLHTQLTQPSAGGDALTVTFAVSGAASGVTWGIDNIEVDAYATPGATMSSDGGVTILHGPPGAPATVGCADGTREAFVDQVQYPAIAGCLATWSGALSMRTPATGAACGDAVGPCAAPGDACAAGWHLCGITGAVSDLRATVSPLECASAGNGTYVSAMSHCGSSTDCAPDTSTGANYACYLSGFCSESVCCGTGCTHFGICTDGVWLQETHIARDGCGSMTAPAGQGVLCCRG